MLGYYGALSAPGAGYFGQGHGDINMNRVICIGAERSLAECLYAYDVRTCDHRNDAGAICIHEDFVSGITVVSNKILNNIL